MTFMSSAGREDAPLRSLAAARILRYARRKAGLTQRQLAEAAGIPQETIARIESSATQPRFDTLARLLDACGYELEVGPRLGQGVDRSLIDWMLAMSPAERLEHGHRAARGLTELHDARDLGRAADDR